MRSSIRTPLSAWLALVLLACSTRKPPTEAPAQHAPAPSSEPSPQQAEPHYQLRIVEYHWELGGSELVVVRGDRWVEYIDITTTLHGGAVEPQWRRRLFQIAAPVLAGLEQLTVSEAFASLQAEYFDPIMHDGANTTLSLRRNDTTKTVHCSNVYPPPVESVLLYVRKHILDGIPGTVPAEPLTRERADALTR